MSSRDEVNRRLEQSEMLRDLSVPLGALLRAAIDCGFANHTFRTAMKSPCYIPAPRKRGLKAGFIRHRL